jgi:hypothetical protein
MISILVAATATGSALIGPVQPSGARAIDYAALTPAETTAIATDLKIRDITPAPPRAAVDIAVEALPAADHQSLALGNYCSGYKLWNPVGLMLGALAAEADRDGTPGAAEGQPLLTIRLTAGRSFRRCVEVAEYNTRCITRVTLAGEAVHRAADGTERRVPIETQVERDSSVAGFCGGIARALGVVSRQAGQELIDKALKS